MERLLMVYETPQKGILMSDPGKGDGPITRRAYALSDRKYISLSKRFNKELDPILYAG